MQVKNTFMMKLVVLILCGFIYSEVKIGYLNADKILYLDNGMIKEFGSHKELIKIDNGFYKKLFEYQFQDSELIEQVI